MSRIALVYNPVCGDSTAEHFFNALVIPRLQAANRIPEEIVPTSAPGDAGKVVLSLLDKYDGDITVVLGSGDGTLHEIVNHLAFATERKHSVRFVLIPCGTANALYASWFRPRAQETTTEYKLRSLEAFLAASTARPLNLSLTSLLDPEVGGPQHDPQPVASIVVTSTALHAAILKDSEKLRRQMPGIERFKVAARQNVTKWYTSHVKLLPVPSSGVIHTYDVEKRRFVPFGDPNASHSALEVHGPFAYFLSTVNVDRLEPEFRINPMISKDPVPSTEISMDLIMIRPYRDPTFTLDTPQARAKFAEKIAAVFAATYQDGNHINLRYSENGGITELGDGNPIVELFRCGGWEWIPDEADNDAHFLCADGTIFEIGRGGRAICRIAPRSDVNFYIHV